MDVGLNSQVKVTLINSIHEITLEQFTSLSKWNDWRDVPVSDIREALEYLEYLVDGSFAFKVEGCKEFDEDLTGLFILVKYPSEDDDSDSEGQLDDYCFFALEDELWTPFVRHLFFWNDSEYLFDAILEAGVEPYPYSQTRFGSDL